MEEEEESIPDKCPVCGKRSNNVLLHIHKKDSCKDKIAPELYDKWKNEANKRSKKKYQKKFVKSGKHSKVQQKYSEKCKKDDDRSYLKVRRLAQAKYINREKVKKNSEERMKEFTNLCCDMLKSLREGETPDEKKLNKFHLIESDFVSRDEVFAWLKDVDGRLLCLVITLQKLCLLPRKSWLGAIWRVDCTIKYRRLWMKDQEEKLYRLIGQLASFRHPFNLLHLIPSRFKLEEKPKPFPKKTPETFTKEHEEELVRLITEILGDEKAYTKDVPMQKLLKLTKENENLSDAMLYCK